MTAITTAAHIDAQTQEELMRQAGIWIEHSTLIEDDLPVRPLAAVQAEKHQLDRYTQLVADRAAARSSKCLAQIEEPPATAAVAPFGYVNTYTGQFLYDVEPCRKDNEGHWRTVYLQPATVALMGEHPPLPEHDASSIGIGLLWGRDKMHSYFDLGRQPSTAAPALEAPAAPSEADIAAAREHIADVHNATQMRSALSQLRSEVVVELVARGLVPSIYAPMAAAPQAPEARVDDLAALVKRLVQALRKAAPNHVLPAQALDYLKRQGLQGSPLRAADAAPQAPAAPSGLPSGWVPCTLTHDGQHPEEVAYGPQIMMDRLKKWLGRYFELLAQAAPAAPEDPMDWPLPCDVTVGHITIRKGCELRTLVLRMQVLYDLSQKVELAAPAAPAEAQRLAKFLQRMRTHLGSCRESAGEYNQQAWDDYERAWTLLQGMAAPAAPAVDASSTDDEIEAEFIQAGGKWTGDYWKIEDADLHPYARRVEHRAALAAQAKEGGEAC